MELEGDKQSLLEQKAELEERVKELEQELDNKQVEAEEVSEPSASVRLTPTWVDAALADLDILANCRPTIDTLPL